MVDKISELLALLDLKEEPSPDDGWFTFSHILANVKGVKEKSLRDKLNQQVSDLKMEKCQWGKNAYYRIKPKV